MKKLKTILVASIITMLLFVTSKVTAQDNVKSIYIKTSATCDMCKATIEKYLAFEKGVKSSNLDVQTKILTVTYNTTKTTPEKIRKAVSKSGYDADEVLADPKAYKKLDDCCKKGKVCEEKK